MTRMIGFGLDSNVERQHFVRAGREAGPLHLAAMSQITVLLRLLGRATEETAWPIDDRAEPLVVVH